MKCTSRASRRRGLDADGKDQRRSVEGRASRRVVRDDRRDLAAKRPTHVVLDIPRAETDLGGELRLEERGSRPHLTSAKLVD